MCSQPQPEPTKYQSAEWGSIGCMQVGTVHILTSDALSNVEVPAGSSFTELHVLNIKQYTDTANQNQLFTHTKQADFILPAEYI